MLLISTNAAAAAAPSGAAAGPRSPAAPDGAAPRPTARAAVAVASVRSRRTRVMVPSVRATSAVAPGTYGGPRYRRATRRPWASRPRRSSAAPCVDPQLGEHVAVAPECPVGAAVVVERRVSGDGDTVGALGPGVDQQGLSGHGPRGRRIRAGQQQLARSAGQPHEPPPPLLHLGQRPFLHASSGSPCHSSTAPCIGPSAWVGWPWRSAASASSARVSNSHTSQVSAAAGMKHHATAVRAHQERCVALSPARVRGPEQPRERDAQVAGLGVRVEGRPQVVGEAPAGHRAVQGEVGEQRPNPLAPPLRRLHRFAVPPQLDGAEQPQAEFAPRRHRQPAERSPGGPAQAPEVGVRPGGEPRAGRPATAPPARPIPPGARRRRAPAPAPSPTAAAGGGGPPPAAAGAALPRATRPPRERRPACGRVTGRWRTRGRTWPRPTSAGCSGRARTRGTGPSAGRRRPARCPAAASGPRGRGAGHLPGPRHRSPRPAPPRRG